MLTETEKGRRNYNTVDFIKFICSILIVAIHIEPFGVNDSSLCALLNYGIKQWLARIAVPFFFAASGFFLYRKSDAENFSPQPTKKYVLKLLKLYIIWTILYLPFMAEEIIEGKKGFVHGLLGKIRDSIFAGSYAHLWYLTAAIVAVILVSFLLSKKIDIKYIIIIAAGFYAVGLLAQSWFGLITPLKTLAPQLWSLLKLSKRVIVTTRNGLFDGFLFVSIGGVIAYKGFNVPKKKAVIGFVVSYLLMLAELIFVVHFKLIRDYDMYISLVPLTFFAFGLAVNCNLPDNRIYKTLRNISSVVFYIHLLVEWAIKKLFDLINVDIKRTCLLFILTVAVSIVFSIIIIKLSETKRLRWLKNLYS